MEGDENCTILVGKTEGKRTLGRPGRMWEVNIKINLRKSTWVYIGFKWQRIGTGGW